MRKLLFVSLLTFSVTAFALPAKAQPAVVWSIGKPDHSASEFALAPNGFRKFIEHDFGFEDKFFLVGHSREKNDFPYVLRGPVDNWGGTWSTSGWRINEVNILFGVENITTDGNYKLVIALADYAKEFPPLIKVSVNNQSVKQRLTAPGYDPGKQKRPSYTQPLGDTLSITGNLAHATPRVIEIPVEKSMIRKGGNCITIEVLEGSWILFDNVRLEGSPLKLVKPGKAFVREVKTADYELLSEDKK
ncbi:MAG TPA: polysaccharide lyase family protein, partial [Agriterribacter sp.]|nr:polysaccharide lyase family protein [Agriterribacter sp.]